MKNPLTTIANYPFTSVFLFTLLTVGSVVGLLMGFSIIPLGFGLAELFIKSAVIAQVVDVVITMSLVALSSVFTTGLTKMFSNFFKSTPDTSVEAVTSVTDENTQQQDMMNELQKTLELKNKQKREATQTTEVTDETPKKEVSLQQQNDTQELATLSIQQQDDFNQQKQTQEPSSPNKPQQDDSHLPMEQQTFKKPSFRMVKDKLEKKNSGNRFAHKPEEPKQKQRQQQDDEQQLQTVFIHDDLFLESETQQPKPTAVDQEILDNQYNNVLYYMALNGIQTTDESTVQEEELHQPIVVTTSPHDPTPRLELAIPLEPLLAPKYDPITQGLIDRELEAIRQQMKKQKLEEEATTTADELYPVSEPEANSEQTTTNSPESMQLIVKPSDTGLSAVRRTMAAESTKIFDPRNGIFFGHQFDTPQAKPKTTQTGSPIKGFTELKRALTEGADRFFSKQTFDPKHGRWFGHDFSRRETTEDSPAYESSSPMNSVD